MNKRKYISWLTWLVLLGLFVLEVRAAPDGENLYQEHCGVCHSRGGLGGIGLPLTAGKLNAFPDSYIRMTVRVGRPGRIMPAFESLSDAQIDIIIQYLRKTFGASRPVVFDQAAIRGDAANGKRLFDKHCEKCHGEDGLGQGLGTGVSQSRERDFSVMPPAISNPGFLKAASDAFIKESILAGRPGTEMASYKKRGLLDSEVNDIVSFLRSFEKPANVESQLTGGVNTPEEALKPTLVFDSPYDFKTTAENLKLAISGKNFRYFPDRLLEEGLASADKLNRKQLTVRFCNFDYLYKMLKVEPRLGVLLPCRITIVENEQGKVQLIAINMNLAAKLFNNQQLEQMAGEMQQAQTEIIEEAIL